jgi:MoxR-like ATPase
MAERSVTIAGERHELTAPFFVLATENPIEMEGTYPLPEAQLDRFLLKILVPTPDESTLVAILNRTTGTVTGAPTAILDAARILDAQALVRRVTIADPLVRWVARLVRASDPSSGEATKSAKAWVRYGAGVRGAQSMILAAKAAALIDGRLHVSLADLLRVAPPALRHRLVPSFEAEADAVAMDVVIERLLEEVPALPKDVAAMDRA